MTVIPANHLLSHHQMAFLSRIKKVHVFLSGCPESHMRLAQKWLFGINVFIGKDNNKYWLQKGLILESNAILLERKKKILSEVYSGRGMWHYIEGSLITQTNTFGVITTYKIALLPECFQLLCSLNYRKMHILTSKFRKNYVFFYQLLCYPPEKVFVCASEYLQKYRKNIL